MTSPCCSSAFNTNAGTKDILCGRGKRCFRHPGNQIFRVIIAKNLETYVAASRMNKTLLIRQLASHIHDSGSRFLKKKKETGMWYDAGICEAKDKIAHAFRDAAGHKVKYIDTLRKTLGKEESLKAKTSLTELMIQPHVESALAFSDSAVPLYSSASFVKAEDRSLLPTPIYYATSSLLEQATCNFTTCEPLSANIIDDLLTMDIEEIPPQEDYHCCNKLFYNLLDLPGADRDRSNSSLPTLV